MGATDNQNVHGQHGVWSAGEWVPIEECDGHFAERELCLSCPDKSKCEPDPTKSRFDVLIIGAGCVGCCAARELSKYNLSVCVVDAADDISNGGATKANSGIVHAGYDDKPGTKRAQFCWPGNQMFPQLDRELNFGYLMNGSLVVARCSEDLTILNDLLERGKINGVKNLRIVHQDELRKMEPSISPDALAALYAPDCGTVTPYEFAIAMAENAVDNGVELRLSRHVTNIGKKDNNEFVIDVVNQSRNEPRSTVAVALSAAVMFAALAILFGVFQKRIAHREMLAVGMTIGTVLLSYIFYGRKSQPSAATESFTAKYVINAAGCGSDKISAMAGAGSFDCKPRMGEYLLLHKDQGKHSRHVLFPAPGKLGKGIVLQPTLWGNLLLGPTARDLHNPEHTSRSTDDIISELIQKCRELSPNFDPGKTIHSFAGARAKNSTGDWIIEESKSVPGFIQAAGIDSPGLAGSPAIALELVRLLGKAGATLVKNSKFNPYRRPIIKPKRGWKGVKIGHEDPNKNIVCKCEIVSEAEIADAVHRSLPCNSTQAVRKRTRAGMGHCQGEFCEPRVKKIISRETGLRNVDTRPWPASSILPQRWLTDSQKSWLRSFTEK